MRNSKYDYSELYVSADIGIELEISFRKEVSLFNLSNENEFQAMLKLLRYSIEFAKLSFELSPNIGRIPYLLISDMLERETISVASRVWSAVEDVAVDLTAPALFSRGCVYMIS